MAGDGSLQKSFVWPPAPGRGEAACCHSTLTSDHHQAGDRAPGDQPGAGGDPGPLLLHLLLTFPTRGQCRPLAARPQGCSFPSLATPPPAAAAEARLLFVANDLDTAELSPAADPASSPAPPSCHTWQRPLAELSGQRSRVHSIYIVSTHYLQIIYTVSTPDTCQYQDS